MRSNTKEKFSTYSVFIITSLQDTMDLCPVWMKLKLLVMLVKTTNQVYLSMGSSASFMGSMPSTLKIWNSLLAEMPSAILLLNFMTVKKLLRYAY